MKEPTDDMDSIAAAQKEVDWSVEYRKIKDKSINLFKPEVEKILCENPGWAKYRKTHKWKNIASDVNTQLSILFQDQSTNDKGRCNREKTTDRFKSGK